MLSKQQIQKLFKKYATPKHVIAHSEKVAEIAVDFGKKLVKSGEKVDLDLVYTSAMLHDLVKICDIQDLDPEKFLYSTSKKEREIWKEIREKWKNIDHGEAAAKILKEMGETKIAEVIRKHKFIYILDPENAPKTWEEKLLYYADKRVMHDRIVTLKERIKDGRRRYLKTHSEREFSKKAEKKVFELEKEIRQ